MTVTFPPFSGTDTECPKCGNDRARTEYKDSVSCMYADHSHQIRADGGNPRLCRQCERCDFAWDEACIDTLAPAPEPKPEPVDKGEAIAAVTHHSQPPKPGLPPSLPPPGAAAAAAAISTPQRINVSSIVLHEDDTLARRRRDAEDTALRRALSRGW